MAFLPLVVFLVIYVGCGITFTLMGAESPFGMFPRHVAILVGIGVALLLAPEIKISEKLDVFCQGMGNSGVMMTILIYLMAGGFQGAAAAMGGKESVINLSLSVLPVSVLIPGVFLMCCLISTAIGTSMGTIAAMAPVAIGVAQGAGLNLAAVSAAVIGGAYFGDNLSMISDTTIAAVKTQGCEMRDKFKQNFLIVLPAAIITTVIFLVLARSHSFSLEGAYDFNIYRVIPYLVVLIGALLGVNVFVVLITGTVLSLIVGVVTGAMEPSQMFTAIGTGVTGMYDITVITMIVACIVSLVREYGGIHFILSFIKKRINSAKGGELGIAVLSMLVDCCTANNTVAIVMVGPIAKEISDDFGIQPKRSASLLDMFTSTCQGLIPWGAQLLSAASLTALTPYEIIPFCFYPILMGVSGLVFIFLRKR